MSLLVMNIFGFLNDLVLFESRKLVLEIHASYSLGRANMTSLKNAFSREALKRASEELRNKICERNMDISPLLQDFVVMTEIYIIFKKIYIILFIRYYKNVNFKILKILIGYLSKWLGS